MSSTTRVHPEASDPLRSPFEVDRRRIIECTAFRRLEHKTQVFAPAHHDHFRTRMTHTLEAADIARCLAANVKANVALAEAITLAHDLGHPPFGHAGEAALDEMMSAQSGFNHNVHTLRVVEYLEHPFPMFRGLNLTRGTLAGLRAHVSRYDAPGNAEAEAAITTEADIASIADRIAYNCHDLEDAIGAGLIDAAALQTVAIWSEASENTGIDGSGLRPVHAIRRQVLDAIVDALLADVVRRISTGTIAQRKLVRPPVPTVSPLAKGGGSEAFSPQMEQQLQELESFLFDRVYRHAEVAGMDADGKRIIRELFAAFVRSPGDMPMRFAERVERDGVERVVCDYIAGMTDRFCMAERGRVEGS